MVKYFPINRDKCLTVKEQLLSHYKPFTFGRLQGVVDIGRKGNEYYVAYRFLSKHDNYRDETQCLVVSTKVRGDILYIMERWEEFEPKFYNCPKRILKILTAPKTYLSNDWRNKCLETLNLERIKRQKQRAKKSIVVVRKEKASRKRDNIVTVRRKAKAKVKKHTN